MYIYVVRKAGIALRETLSGNWKHYTFIVREQHQTLRDTEHNPNTSNNTNTAPTLTNNGLVFPFELSTKVWIPTASCDSCRARWPRRARSPTANGGASPSHVACKFLRFRTPRTDMFRSGCNLLFQTNHSFLYARSHSALLRNGRIYSAARSQTAPTPLQSRYQFVISLLCTFANTN